MKIFAIDDDETILAILVEALKLTGFPDVKTDTCGLKALEQLAATSQTVDCFLLDIQMPTIDGIDLCEKIRELPGHAKTPIIMLTAMSERDYVDRAFKAGATDYVTKPFDVMELGTRVKMAERLSAEIKNSQESYRTLEAITQKLTAEEKVPIYARLDVNDVEHFLAYHVFENYVGMLQRGKFYSSNLFAIKVTNAVDIHHECEGGEFEFLIGSIADAISDNLTATDIFFTYAGNGIFVCIYNRLKDTVVDNFSTLVQDEIDQMGLMLINGKPVEAHIDFGPTVSPSIFSKPGKTNLVEIAIQKLGHTPGSETGMDMATNWSMSQF
jgi:DNA-binding response OmpR family regulator